jgi:hypothetical protein
VGYAGRGQTGGALDGGSEDISSDEGGDDAEDEVQSPRDSRRGGGGGGEGEGEGEGGAAGRGVRVPAPSPPEGGTKAARSEDRGQTLDTEGGLEFEDQDPFDFSSSLARGREMSTTNLKKKKKKLDATREDVEEEEEEEEEDEEEEEEEKYEKEVVGLQSIPMTSLSKSEFEPSLPCPNTAAPEYQGLTVRSATEQRTYASSDVRTTILKTRKRSLKSLTERVEVGAVGGGVGSEAGAESLPLRGKRGAGQGGDEEAQAPLLHLPPQQPEVSLNLNVDPDWTDGRTLHRCLIFAQHRQTLDLIETCVLQQHFPTVHYRKLDGTVPPAVRAEVAHRFNSQDHQAGAATLPSRDTVEENDRGGGGGRGRRGGGVVEGNEATLTTKMRAGQSTRGDDIRILLMTTRSCGLGLNLTAADTVIL